MAMMGVYYSIDIPSALHQQLKDYMPANSDFEYDFNLLYTLYSFPNIILPFFGGNLVDRFSASICLIVFFIFTFLGQLIFAIGVSMKNWNLMLLGRLVIGFGGENMCVAQSALIASWFSGKELAFSFGVGLAISRLGSVLNNITSPVVANIASVPVSVSLGVGVNALSLILGIVLFILDRRGNKKCQRINEATAGLTESLLEEEDFIEEDYYGAAAEPIPQERNKEEIKESVSLRDVGQFGVLFWLLALSCVVVYGCVIPFNNVASGILLERNFFKDPKSECVLEYPNQCSTGTLQNSTNPALDPNGNICTINKFTAPILPHSINVTNEYTDATSSWENSQYGFVDLKKGDIDCNDPFWADACTKDYCDALKSATETAGRIMSIPYFISAALSPLLGHLVDKVGRRAIVASFAPTMLLVVHMTLALSSKSPVLPLIGQGVAYSLFAAVIWPSVPLTVDERLTGTAFGVITAVQNLGLTVFPLVVAYLYKVSRGRYIPSVEFFFASCAFFGVIIGIMLNVMDARRGGKLNARASSNNSQNGQNDDFQGGKEQHEGGYITTIVPTADSDYIQ